MKPVDSKNSFSLIQRPINAIEKTEPSVKRILDVIVADTLALAEIGNRSKTDFSLLVCSLHNSGIAQSIEAVVQQVLGETYNVRLTECFLEAEIIDLAHRQPFDLVVPIINNIFFDNVRDRSEAGIINSAVKLVTHLKSQCKMPVIVLGGLKNAKNIDWSNQLEEAGVDAFFWLPFSLTEFTHALNICLRRSYRGRSKGIS